MAKPKKDRSRKPASAPDEAASVEPSGDEAHEKPKKKGKRDGTRETVESIVVAFILAFLFRTFEAEAFVIPTGSMAPTLFGRHKDVDCPQCGTHFHVGASDEVRFNHGRFADDSYLNEHARLQTTFCPNCRVEIDIEDARVFTGDRILVNKWPYEFGEPDRWDVIVFKYPEDPKTNYIKRLVGLPGEELRIERGDVHVRRENGGWKILRKDDPNKQRDLQIPVYDDRHPPTQLLEAGWPERWGPVVPTDVTETAWVDGGDWTADPVARSYEVDAKGEDVEWLRYRHFLPAPADWEALPKVAAPRAQLITDYLAYNTYTGGGDQENALIDNRYWTGLWVGDLTVEGRITVERAEGQLLLEMCRGFRHVRCTIDLATGVAELEDRADGLDREAPVVTPLGTADTGVDSAGTYNFAFANVDRRVVLWINGRIVRFDGTTTYGPPNLPGPHVRDLAPVGIGASGAHVRVDRLQLLRDIYYRSEKYNEPPRDGAHAGVQPGHAQEIAPNSVAHAQLAQLRSDPETWAQVYDEASNGFVQFHPLGSDEYFMLGDNSARSLDSRLWKNGETNPLLRRPNAHAAKRSALVGKAFFVYWPHGVPFLNGGKGYSGFAKHVPLLNRFFYHRTPPTLERLPNGNLVEHPPEVTDYPRISLPFYPQFWRMQRIR